MENEKIYGPKIRISNESEHTIKNFNNKHNTNIPSPKTNPIVVNNIATSEFDYTEEP